MVFSCLSNRELLNLNICAIFLEMKVIFDLFKLRVLQNFLYYTEDTYQNDCKDIDEKMKIPFIFHPERYWGFYHEM